MRSVSIGFWIGAGSRDETDSRAGISHLIEHLLFKERERYPARAIAEIFDTFGGELNAATSREHTVVYARIADHHLAEALDVITDMVARPAFVDLDAEREVVLEEIAMYEDTPQDLVHDLLSEAVFGRHALGRPVVGRTEVISSVSPPRSPPTTAHATRRRTSSSPRLATSRTTASPACWTRRRGKWADPPASPRRVRAPLVKAPAPGLRFQRKDTEQYHVCVGATGDLALGPAALRGLPCSTASWAGRPPRGSSRRSVSGAGWRTRSTTFLSQYTDSGQIGLYVGTREENLSACLEIAAAEIADVAAGGLRPSEVERAKENLKGRIMLAMESTSSRMSRLGKSVITETEILSVNRLLGEIDGVEPDEIADLAGVLLAPERLSAAGIGPARALPRRPRPGQPVARRPRRGGVVPMEIALFGHRGRVGSVLAPALVAAGHQVRGFGRDDPLRLDGCGAAVDFTRPDAVAGNVEACLDAGVHAVVGTSGMPPEELERLAETARGRSLVLLPRAELRGRSRSDDALRRRGRAPAPPRRDRGAPPRDEGGRTLGHGEGDRRADGRATCRFTPCGFRG